MDLQTLDIIENIMTHELWTVYNVSKTHITIGRPKLGIFKALSMNTYKSDYRKRNDMKAGISTHAEKISADEVYEILKDYAEKNFSKRLIFLKTTEGRSFKIGKFKAFAELTTGGTLRVIGESVRLNVCEIKNWDKVQINACYKIINRDQMPIALQLFKDSYNWRVADENSSSKQSTAKE